MPVQATSHGEPTGARKGQRTDGREWRGTMLGTSHAPLDGRRQGRPPPLATTAGRQFQASIPTAA